MDYIDFDTTPNSVASQLINTIRNLDTDNNEKLYDFYRFMLMCRHNILHYFVLRVLGKCWIDETKLKEYFPTLPEEYARKTPDIVYETDSGLMLIIDVSVSVDIHSTEISKKTKYLPICEWLNNSGVACLFIHINVAVNYKNLDQELSKLDEYAKSGFDYVGHSRCLDIIEANIETVSRQIDKKYFEKRKLEELEKRIMSNKQANDEVVYTELGIYKDIDIDSNAFKSFNSNFKHEETIYNTYENADIESIEKEIYSILENDTDPIFLKFMDHKLNAQQFDDAERSIKSDVDCRGDCEPKPTHHVMMPYYDDLQYWDGSFRLCEQDTILEFMKCFLSDFNDIENHQTDNKLNLFENCFKGTLNCFDGVDGQVYKDLFYDRGDKWAEERAKYKKIKTMQRFVETFRKRRKVSQRLLDELELNIIKTDSVNIEKRVIEMEKEIKAHDRNLSFLSYLKHIGVLTSVSENYVKANKLVKLKIGEFTESAREGFKKAGIKADVHFRKEPDAVVKSLKFEQTKNMDLFLERLSDSKPVGFEDLSYHLDEFIYNEKFGHDHYNFNHIKSQSVLNFGLYFKNIQRTYAYDYFHNQHNFYNQLMHINSAHHGENGFYFMTCGIKNMLIIVLTTFSFGNAEMGKPFICMIKTKNPQYYTTGVFGKVKTRKIKDSEYYYVYTNWRRLGLSKITYLRDAHFSVISTSMNTAMSSPNPDRYLVNKKLVKIYTLRGVIAHCTTQKVGELLMDNRYAYMSSLSVYSNIGKLLVEKFGGPKRTLMELWIVGRIMNRLKMINEAVHNDGIIQNKAVLDLNIRDINTIGGVINLPSLWLDEQMTDITELLDEAFIYIHTMKEPSSVFHEYIKALKTIIKFENEYRSLPQYIKTGSITNGQELRNYLLYPTQIGCCTPIIIESTKLNIKQEKPFFEKYIHNLNDESIGDLLSTKAVISDINREVIAEDKLTKREIQKHIYRFETLHRRQMTTDELENLKYYFLQTHSTYYNNRKTRQKVMETVLEYINKEEKMNKTIDLANYFIKNEKGKVLTDICIKAQYGSKREFYVVNLGAKGLARITEKFFRDLSTNSQHEAISIPGDKKIIAMQKMLDRIYFNPLTSKHKIMYSNGDCTKWSAAETMYSFLAMVIALKPHITENLYQLLIATFNSWTNKEIQVPMEIYNKVVPSDEYDTSFLADLKKQGKTTMHSTQNFLQGMFNYSSSYKAVCCTNYTIQLWKKLYPESKMIFEHMEHSDDYVMVVLYENIKDFEKFRVLHKIMMRLHGYNDSDRKTCSQPYIMEFVSQMSFNGVMLYPQIKKTKEVNLSLPCTGYKTDMEAALSRVGECSRVGCNQSFLYFFQRLHCYIVANAYSVTPGLCNNGNRSYTELMNDPLELFGIPDTLPILSLYCRGNGNNYRLYHYGDEKTKKKIQYLYDKAEKSLKIEEIACEDPSYKYSIHTPRFMYEMFNRSLIKLKKNLNYTPQQAKEFWEKNISYKLIKPKDKEMLKEWICAMFYNRTFMEAYLKNSRANMTMRISKFVKNPIVVDYVLIEDHGDKKMISTRAKTISEYLIDSFMEINKWEQKITKENEIKLLKVISNCDPTYDAIYSILPNVTVARVNKRREKTTQIVHLTPPKLKTLNIINQPAILIQYLYNTDNFLKDKRTVISMYSLEKDIAEIKRRIDPYLLKSNEMMAVLSVFNDLMISSEKQIVMFGHDRRIKTLNDSILDTMANNFQPGKLLHLTQTNVTTIRDPMDQKPFYVKGMRLISDFHRQCLDSICLIYVFLKGRHNFSTYQIHKVTKDLCFHEPITDTLVSCYDILSQITPDMVKQHDYTLTEHKIAAYLKYVLTNDTELMNDLINMIYSFTYKYIQMDSPVGGVYLGRTVVSYTHFNTVVEATYDHKLWKSPIIIMEKHYDSVKTILYNIALRLTGQITNNEFEQDPSKDNLKLMWGHEILALTNYLNDQRVNVVIKPGEKDNMIKIENVKPTDQYYPIFLTKRTLRRKGERHIPMKKIIPKVNEELMSVYLQRSKLFTLPFWRCKQYDNIVYNGNLIIDLLPFKYYLMDANIEKMILSPGKLYVEKIPIKDVTPAALKQIFLETIKLEKIYGLNLSKVLTETTDELTELLDYKPQRIQSQGQSYINKNDILRREPLVYEDFFADNEKEYDMSKALIFKYLGRPEGVAEETKNEKNMILSMLGGLSDNENHGTFDDDMFMDDDPDENCFIDDYDEYGELIVKEEKPVGAFMSKEEEKEKNDADDVDTIKNNSDEDFFVDDAEIDVDETLKMFEEDDFRPINMIDHLSNITVNEIEQFLITDEEKEMALRYGDNVYQDDNVQTVKYGFNEIDDFLVLNPKQTKIDVRYNQTQGYMVKKLKFITPLIVRVFEQRNRITTNNTYMTITNYIDIANQIINCFSVARSEMEYLSLLLCLRKLLCQTYITNPNTPQHKRTFRIENDNLILCFWCKDVFNLNQKRQLANKKLIIEEQDKNILLVMTKEQFYEKMKNAQLNLIEPKQSLRISPYLDQLIIDMTLRYTEQYEVDEFMGMLE